MKKIMYLIAFTFFIFSCSKDETQEPVPAPNTQNFPEQFSQWRGLFNGEGIGAAFNLTEDIIVLFDKDGERYAWFENEEIKFVNDLNATDSPFVNCIFNQVGASAKTREDVLYVFDDEGARYTNAAIDLDRIDGGWDDPELFDWWQSYSPTNNWGPDNTIPINSVSAIWPLTDPGSGCFDAIESFEQLWMADGNGDDCVLWHIEDFYWPGVEIETEDYTAENNCGGQDGLIPFESTGAVCRYVKPNAIEEIFFSKDGTQFCFYSVSEGIVSPIYNLY